MTTQTAEVEEKVRDIVKPWKGKQGSLIPILQAIQHEFGYLKEDAIEFLSREIRIPTAEIYG